MTETLERPRQPEGRMRPEGARAVRPRQAATLLLVRRDGPKPRVLMGKRHGGHDFMPNLWVFPGGRIDRNDHRAPFAADLSRETAGIFEAHIPLTRGRALALAAVRETWEEAGLLLARPAEPRPAAGPWRPFLEQGALPDLSGIEIIARAITPPMLAKRFDTWFLTVDATHLMSLERKPDCGELEEIAWFDFDEALALNLPAVTRTIVKETVARIEEPERPRLFMRFQKGGAKISHL